MTFLVTLCVILFAGIFVAYHYGSVGSAKRLTPWAPGAGSVEAIAASGHPEDGKQFEHLWNCVLASIVEGVMAVDDQERILFVNSELMNIFQLTHSPVRGSVREVLSESNVPQLVGETIRTGGVQSELMRRKYSAESGRPLTYEVRTIPALVRDGKVTAVIVLFLPPADRPRMIQTLRWHARKLNYLVNELNANGAAAEYSPKIEEIEPNAFFLGLRARFLAGLPSGKPTFEVTVAPDSPSFRADPAALEATLAQLLENVLWYAEDELRIALKVSPLPTNDVMLLISVEGCDFPAQEVALITSKTTMNSMKKASDIPIFGNRSNLMCVRENIEAQSGNFRIESDRKKQILFSIRFPGVSA